MIFRFAAEVVVVDFAQRRDLLVQFLPGLALPGVKRVVVSVADGVWIEPEKLLERGLEVRPNLGLLPIFRTFGFFQVTGQVHVSIHQNERYVPAPFCGLRTFPAERQGFSTILP